MIEEVVRDPISVSMLKIGGNDIIKKFHVEPGPKIGHILNALLEEVLEDPAKNTEMFLVKQVENLLKLPDEELKKLGEQGKEEKDQAENTEIQKIRKNRQVK